MPTAAQLESLYVVSYWITYLMLQPIHLVCIDERTNNLYVLAGLTESLEIQVLLNGNFSDESN